MSITFDIFGASGDLTSRKLIPALFHLHGKGRLPENTRLVGFSRTPLSHAQWRQQLAESTRAFVGDAFGAEAWEPFARSISYLPGDLSVADDLDRLKEFLHELEILRGFPIPHR